MLGTIIGSFLFLFVTHVIISRVENLFFLFTICISPPRHVFYFSYIFFLVPTKLEKKLFRLRAVLFMYGLNVIYSFRERFMYFCLRST